MVIIDFSDDLHKIAPEKQIMKRFFPPNIGTTGRILRGLVALGLFAGAWFAFGAAAWLGIVLAACGGFVLFEAVRGWCWVRACGIKTKF